MDPKQLWPDTGAPDPKADLYQDVVIDDVTGQSWSLPQSRVRRIRMRDFFKSHFGISEDDEPESDGEEEPQSGPAFGQTMSEPAVGTGGNLSAFARLKRGMSSMVTGKGEDGESRPTLKQSVTK